MVLKFADKDTEIEDATPSPRLYAFRGLLPVAIDIYRYLCLSRFVCSSVFSVVKQVVGAVLILVFYNRNNDSVQLQKTLLQKCEVQMNLLLKC